MTQSAEGVPITIPELDPITFAQTLASRQKWTQLHLVRSTEFENVKIWKSLRDVHGDALDPNSVFHLPGFTDWQLLKGIGPLRALSLIGFALNDPDFEFLNCSEESLHSLSLRGIGIGSHVVTKISNILKDSPLMCLDLGRNSVDISGAQSIARCFSQLEHLKLDSNSIGDDGIQALANAYKDGSFRKLSFLDLRGNRIQSVDEAILRSKNAKRILETVLRGVALPHARVMIVGTGGMGKSWLLRSCFLKKPPLPDQQRVVTPDIDFFQAQDSDVNLGQHMLARPAGMKTTIWDFGGQAVKHGVHEGFFADADQRTVYLLVVSARREPGNGTGDTDETTGNRIVYWLKTLAHFVGPEAPVVIAITQCDNYNLAQSNLAVGWQKKRPIDETIDWSAYLHPKKLQLFSRNIKSKEHTRPMKLKETPVEMLVDIFQLNVVAIIDGISAIDSRVVKKTGGRDSEIKIQELRIAIAQAIEQHTRVLKAKVPAKYPTFARDVDDYMATRTWSKLKDFREWCKKDEIGVPDKDEQDFLLPLLNSHGHLFYFGRVTSQVVDLKELPAGQRHRMWLRHEYRYKDLPINLENTVIHPGWLKECVYRIVDKSPDREKRGWFSRTNDLRPMIRQSTEKLTLPRQSSADDQLILEFLECTELCWKADHRRGYLFPRGLDATRPDEERLWQSWPCAPLWWNFLPDANFFRLIVALHKTIIEQQSCVVEMEGQMLHGRNWVRVFDPQGSGVEAVLMAFSNENRLEVRFDPARAGTARGREWIIQKVHHLMENIQGEAARDIPLDPLRWRGKMLVDPDPKIAPEPKIVLKYYRIGQLFKTSGPTSQKLIAKELCIDPGTVTRQIVNMQKHLGEVFPHCRPIGILVGTGKLGISNEDLTEIGEEAMRWSEVWFPDLLKPQDIN